ncbi:MAG: hypothetical protein SGCHY_004920 [Lobulomycetales sp.]
MKGAPDDSIDITPKFVPAGADRERAAAVEQVPFLQSSPSQPYFPPLETVSSRVPLNPAQNMNPAKNMNRVSANPAPPQYGAKGYGSQVMVQVDKPIDRWNPSVEAARLEPQQRPRPRYLGCFRHRKGACCFCFLAVIVILGLATFFLFPRIPDVNVSDPILDDSLASVQTRGNALTASPANPFEISMQMRIDVTSKSGNYIDWVLDEVRTDGILLDAATGGPNDAVVAFGSVRDARIRGMDTSVISLPITVTYTSTSPVTSLTSDPAFLALIAPCGLNGQPRRPVSMRYSVAIEHGILKAFGYTPTFDGVSSFPCPVSQDTLAQIINSAVFAS